MAYNIHNMMRVVLKRGKKESLGEKNSKMSQAFHKTGPVVQGRTGGGGSGWGE